MVSAGFDRSAARWQPVLAEGSLGWAVLALATPAQHAQVSASQVSSFIDGDESDQCAQERVSGRGSGGLGRISDGDRDSLNSDLGIGLGGQTRWIRAITSAAARRDDGLVALLAAMGMQGNDWSAMTPRQLYHIVSSLRIVGLGAEARMIAAEAVSRA